VSSGSLLPSNCFATLLKCSAIWRDPTETVTTLEPGISVLIGFQERFQFRAFDQPLELILATIPGWPGADEAVFEKEGKWPLTISK